MHNNVDDTSSIGKIAKWAVESAVDAGWEVTVVARDLDPALSPRVTHLPLHVPRRAHAVQWLAARRTVRAAIGNRKFDVVHVHQPQLVAMADVMQCHFLLRSAKERGGLGQPVSLRQALTQMQQRFVMHAEEATVRRWPSKAFILFDSELLRDEFDVHYGAHANSHVLLYPAPPFEPVGDVERAAARVRWTPDALPNDVVVGYLGGIDSRKGYDRLVAALVSVPGSYLLGAGPGSAGWHAPELHDRQRWVGQVSAAEVKDVFAALDVLVVPSRFEPFGLVCFEAAARGIPVITSEDVGALATLERYGAGRRWPEGESLFHALRWAVDQRASTALAAEVMVREHSSETQAAELLKVYQRVLARRQ